MSWASLLIALALWLGALATFAVVKPLDARLALSTASSPDPALRGPCYRE